MAGVTKYGYARYTSATGSVIKNGTGTLGAVIVNKALVGTVTLKDGATTIATLTNGTTAPLGSVIYNVQFGSNLNISLTTAAEDITIAYE